MSETPNLDMCQGSAWGFGKSVLSTQAFRSWRRFGVLASRTLQQTSRVSPTGVDEQINVQFCSI